MGILIVGYLVCLNMVLWLLMVYSLNSLAHSVVQMLTADNFYLNALIHYIVMEQSVVRAVGMDFHLCLLLLIGYLFRIVIS